MRTIVVSDIFGVIYDMKLTVLALWLLNQASPDLASVVARYLLVDARPSQAPYMIPDHLARRSARRALRALCKRPAR
jgi:hypothetical protein